MEPQSAERTGGQAPLPVGMAAADDKGVPTRGLSPTPYIFLAPYLALFFTFVLIPAVYGFWISLHNWDYLLPGKPFVGLQNYVNLFTPGSATFGPFWSSMEATAKFTLYSVPLLVVIPLFIALLLNQNFPGRNFFRAMYFAPYVLGVAVIGVLWRFILDPSNGLINNYLGTSIPWITALPWAYISMVAVTVWWTLGFNAVIYLAGLQDIDAQLYEAAKVDGANAWQRFRNVTIPGLRPVMIFVVTTTILASANVFGQAYLITQGEPSQETRTAIMYIAEEGLRNFRMGNAAAMSYVLTIFLMLISILNFVFLRERGD